MKEKETDIISIFEEIAINNKSGTLEIIGDENTKDFYLYFSSGEIVYIQITPSENSKLLGQILLNYGYITEEELQQVLNEQKDNPESFIGDILLEKDIIDQITLFQLFKFKIQYVLFLLNVIEKKGIEFKEGDLPQRTPQIPYSITLKQIMNIQEKITQNLNLFKNLEIDFKDFIKIKNELSGPLNPEEEKIYDLIRYNNYNIIDLMNKTSVTSPIHLLNIINSFIDRDIIEFVKKEETVVKGGKEKEKPSKEEPKEETEEEPKFDTELNNIILKRILTTLEELVPVIILLISVYFIGINLANNDSLLNNISNKFGSNTLKREQTVEILKIIQYHKRNNLTNFPQKDRWGSEIVIQNNLIISRGKDQKLNTSDDIKLRIY